VDDRVVFDCSDEEYGPIDFGINELVKQLDAHQKLTKP